MEDSVPEKVYISDLLALSRQFKETQTTFQIQFSYPEEASSFVFTQSWLRSSGLKLQAKALMCLNYVYETHQEA